MNEEIIYNQMVDGIKFLSLDKFDKAISCFDEVLDVDNFNFAALNNKAIALNGLNNFKDAISIFDKILYCDSKFIFSLIGKGESLFKLGYYDAAILYFDRALKIDAENDLALLNKAKVFECCNQFEDALGCLDKVKWISGYEFIGKSRYKRVLNNFKKESFNQRIAFIKKIDAYVNLNEFGDVYAISQDALDFDKNSIYFMYNKAYSAYRLNKVDEALSLLNEILKIDFMNIDVLDIKSRIFIKLKKFTEALQCLDNIKRFGGFVDSSLYNDVASKANNLAGNLDKIQKFIFQGNDLIRSGDLKGALEYYDLALKLDSSSVIASNNKGYVYYLLGDYSQAIKSFNSVLMYDKNHVYSLIGKSYSLYYLQNYSDSLKCFNKAIHYDNSLYDEKYVQLLNDKICYG